MIPAWFKQERLLNEMKKTTETSPKGNRVSTIKADAPLSGSKAPVQTEASKTVTMSSSPKLCAPLFTKKDKTQGVNMHKNAMVNETVKVKQTEDETCNKGVKVQAPHPHPHPHDPSSIKLSNKQSVNKPEASLAQSSRPSNPFLKSTIK